MDLHQRPGKIFIMKKKNARVRVWVRAFDKVSGLARLSIEKDGKVIVLRRKRKRSGDIISAILPLRWGKQNYTIRVSNKAGLVRKKQGTVIFRSKKNG